MPEFQFEKFDCFNNHGRFVTCDLLLSDLVLQCSPKLRHVEGELWTYNNKSQTCDFKLLNLIIVLDTIVLIRHNDWPRINASDYWV